MAVHHGKNGLVKIGAATALEVTKWTIREQVATDDTTAMGKAAQTHVTGIPGWSGSLDANTDYEDDTGQGALTIGASVTIGLYSDGSAAGKTFFSGTATVTEIGRDTSFSAKVTATFSFQGNGALVRSEVPA